MTRGQSSEDALIALRDRLRVFSREREWDQFHSPRNLLLALTGEVGELAALVQWIPDPEVDSALQQDPLRTDFADELADCLIYLIQLADRVGIDLALATEHKIASSSKRYPTDLASGVSIKYTRLGTEST